MSAMSSVHLFNSNLLPYDFVDEPVSNQQQPLVSAAPLADLWLGDDLLATPATAPAAFTQQSTAPAAAAALVSSQPLVDDLWGGTSTVAGLFAFILLAEC